MTNRKAFELPIATLIVIILGLLLLLGLSYVLTGGFKSLKSSSDPYLDTTQTTSIKTACQLACDNRDQITYCCYNYTIKNQKTIKCGDEILDIKCSIQCSDVQCPAN